MNEPLRLSTDAPCADRVGVDVFFRIGFVGHMHDVAGLLRHPCARFAVITFIQTQMLLGRGRVWSRDGERVQRRFQQLPVGSIRPADHEAQRHAMFIHQQTAFRAPFASIGRVFPSFFAAQGGFGYRAICRLPLPRDTFEFVILGQTGLPHAPEDARAQPALKIAVRGLSRTKFLGQRVPLTARAQNVQNTAHHRAPIRRRAATYMFPILATPPIPRSRCGQQWLDAFPEAIRQFPAGNVGVLCWCLFRRLGHACILRSKQV